MKDLIIKLIPIVLSCIILILHATADRRKTGLSLSLSMYIHMKLNTNGYFH